jgi:hypothetical protein
MKIQIIGRPGLIGTMVTRNLTQLGVGVDRMQNYSLDTSSLGA